MSEPVAEIKTLFKHDVVLFQHLTYELSRISGQTGSLDRLSV